MEKTKLDVEDYFSGWDGWYCEVEDSDGNCCGETIGCCTNDMARHLKEKHGIDVVTGIIEDKPILKINRKDFMKWYLSTELETEKSDLYESLMDDGEYSIDIEDIWKKLGYIHMDKIENKEVVKKEDIVDEEIAEPSNKYNVIWVY